MKQVKDMSPEAVAILTQVAHLLVTQGAHMQGSYARDNNYQPQFIGRAAATCYCLLGGITKVSIDNGLIVLGDGGVSEALANCEPAMEVCYAMQAYILKHYPNVRYAHAEPVRACDTAHGYIIAFNDYAIDKHDEPMPEERVKNMLTDMVEEAMQAGLYDLGA